jgi:hypothetical protein
MEHIPYLVLEKPDFSRGDFDASPAFAVSSDGVGAHPEKSWRVPAASWPPEFLFQSIGFTWAVVVSWPGTLSANSHKK